MTVINMQKIIEFEWDKGNMSKSRFKHGVTNQEAEDAFRDELAMTFEDTIHTTSSETRYTILGVTPSDRLLYIVFTLRLRKVRIISARDVNIKERIAYD
jgi:uncharacterized protein